MQECLVTKLPVPVYWLELDHWTIYKYLLVHFALRLAFRCHGYFHFQNVRFENAIIWSCLQVSAWILVHSDENGDILNLTDIAGFTLKNVIKKVNKDRELMWFPEPSQLQLNSTTVTAAATVRMNISLSALI